MVFKLLTSYASLSGVNSTLFTGRTQSIMSFASLGDDGQNSVVDGYISEETKKRNKKFKLPWFFM